MKTYKKTKEEYKEMMIEKRKELFDKSNKQVQNIIKNDSDFLEFLRLLTLGYTVSNTLMIMSENPHVTLLKDYYRWKELDIYPKKDVKGIPVLEPSGKEYIRKDGTKGINYNVKYLFDVSQTTNEDYKPEEINTKDIDFIKALSFKSYIPIIYIEDISKCKRDVFYDENDKCIYVNNNLSKEDIIVHLIKEYVLLETLKPDSYVKHDQFIIGCVTYMICMKYQFSYKDLSFMNDFVSYFGIKSIKVIKKNLDDIRTIFKEICTRIDYGIYALNYSTNGNNNV